MNALLAGLPAVGTPEAFRGLDIEGPGLITAALSEMAATIRDVSGSSVTRREPPAALSLAAYCERWGAFLGKLLNRRIDFTDVAQAVAPPPIDGDVAAALAPLARDLLPIGVDKYPVSPDALQSLAPGLFGFSPRESEMHWLWSASWYFGFLFEDGARGLTLRLSLIEVTAALAAADISVHVDGHPFVCRIDKDTQTLDVPLLDAGKGAGSPILIEFFLPEARRPGDTDGYTDDRWLGLCIVQIEIMHEQAPLFLDPRELDSFSPEEFVAYSYQRILGKVADQDGLGHYAYLLSTGVTRRDVIEILTKDSESRYPQGVVFAH